MEGISARWAAHYATLLNGGIAPDASVLDELPQAQIKQELSQLPTMPELQERVKALKNRKSPGIDGIPAEIFKFGGEEVIRQLYLAICTIWETETVPQAWKDSIIISIYKNKGDRAECGNSRGISLLSVAGKLLAKILLKRLIKHVSEDLMPETQCGFRQNRSTSDMIFVARQTMEKCREQHRDLQMCFIDLAKAFDTVERSMDASGCPTKFVKIVSLLHVGMEARVRTGCLESDPFEVSRGVKQGCVLAPVLFNIYISYVTRLLADRVGDNCGIQLTYRTERSLFDLPKLKARTKTHSTWFQELQYADDCALLAHSREDLQEALSAAADLYTKFGLQINARKTEVLSWTVQTSPLQTEALTINGSPLENASSFKYLGAWITCDCKLDTELNNRICQAARSFGRLQNRVFKNHNLTLKTKMKVYTAVCLSTLLYGSEAWTLYARQTRALEAWHIKSLRCILGITWRDRITHEEIFRRTDSSSLETYLSRRQLRWLGHVIRMDDSRLPKQILYGELTVGSRSAGGQKKRHKDHMKVVLKKFDIEPSRLESSAIDRNTWRSQCYTGARNCERKHNDRMRRRRELRHQRNNQNVAPEDGGHPCPICNRICLSRFGLQSHLRAHQRRARGGGAVVIAPDGPP